MKIAVINFSGNTGKSTVSKHLLYPRLKDAEYIAVESINADEGEGEGGSVRGKQFGALQEQLLVMDSAVIDVGSSNVEDFVKLMRQYRGSHEDMDLFVIPTVKEAKQIKDTIATIQALAAMDVSAKKIRVVFNKLEADDT
ncbi:StbB family protein, partial [Xanthomonas phaseoli]